jgi:hypothetical protein
MTISEFISRQLPERQKILNVMHEIIIKTDQGIKAKVEPMMGKDMIVYNAPGTFKYGLSSVKKYMSLHVMPIYVSATLSSEYMNFFKTANFQKGCINFKNEEEMPLNILQHLIQDCSKIDLLKIKEDYIKSKKSSPK